jgi:hypothetical protein
MQDPRAFFGCQKRLMETGYCFFRLALGFFTRLAMTILGAFPLTEFLGTEAFF